LKPQRNNLQNALTRDSAMGKLDKKAVFPPCVEMKQSHAMTEPKEKALTG